MISRLIEKLAFEILHQNAIAAIEVSRDAEDIVREIIIASHQKLKKLQPFDIQMNNSDVHREHELVSADAVSYCDVGATLRDFADRVSVDQTRFNFQRAPFLGVEKL